MSLGEKDVSLFERVYTGCRERGPGKEKGGSGIGA